MTERFSLRAMRAVGVAVAGLLLIVGGAFAADQLANAGRDEGLASPTPVLAPAGLNTSGSDDGPDASESPEASDEIDDDASASPEASDDSDDDDATASPEASDDSDDDDVSESPEPSESPEASESPEPSGSPDATDDHGGDESPEPSDDGGLD